MLTSHVIRLVAASAIVVALAGCDALDIGPGMPEGVRHWVVTVENWSPRPAMLLVAEDGGVMGPAVGTANPSVVQPGATVDVVFGIPAGLGWGIYVNREPGMGPMVTASDVPRDAAGRMPFKILVDPDGDSGAEVPGPAVPGWFGN